jgi:hypothetical protein
MPSYRCKAGFGCGRKTKVWSGKPLAKTTLQGCSISLQTDSKSIVALSLQRTVSAKLHAKAALDAASVLGIQEDPNEAD